MLCSLSFYLPLLRYFSSLPFFCCCNFTFLSLRFLFVYSLWNCLDFLIPWTDIFYKFGEFIAINFSDIYFLGSPSGTPQLNALDCLCISSMSLTVFFYIFHIFVCLSFILVSFCLPALVLASFLQLYLIYFYSSIEFLIWLLSSSENTCVVLFQVCILTVYNIQLCVSFQAEFFICEHGKHYFKVYI